MSQMLYIARDIEQSIIERRFLEFLLTDVPEYNSLVADLRDDTALHRSSIEAKIRVC